MNHKYLLLTFITFFAAILTFIIIRKKNIKLNLNKNINLIQAAPDPLKNLNISKKIDVTLVGSIKEADGLGRISIGLIDSLSKDLNLNFISSRSIIDLNDVSSTVRKIATQPVYGAGNISILLDPLWYPNSEHYKLVPNSYIKIAYSMLESDRIPKKWVNILNQKFDLVVVPSKFLIDVYKNSGVEIPIFQVPHGVYLEDFLKQPIKKETNKIFTFGTSAGIWPHKNHLLLLKSFYNLFGNSNKVKLILHGRFGQQSIIKKIKNFIKKNKINNVELVIKRFTHKEYLNFMKSLDCYVLISKGEGFSITPREALALGIPIIISNNTAHEIICENNFALCVSAPIRAPADYRAHLGMFSGYNFDMHQKDVEKALREIYTNYPKYLAKAHLGKEWVKQYLYSNIKDYFLTLFKPKSIILGPKNKITKKYLMTNSKELYKKYKDLQKTAKQN